ncbi:YibE/F family protein [Cellulomonas fimi]|uniref:YibE/F family protein n=1 Tax=Cellulomonas fimi TaxID=1708 RepID=UPI00234DA727|nr:YibE/F family protein [Cellulomonas fimi]MDC7120351.1 YibE/F family protein [Cellulomonas fimi]
MPHSHLPPMTAPDEAAAVDADAVRVTAARARVWLAAVLGPVLLLTLVGAWWLWPSADARPPVLDTTGPGVTYTTGEVTEVRPDATGMDQAAVRLADGEVVDLHVPPEYVPEVVVGDRVRVAAMSTADVGDLTDVTAEPTLTTTYVFVDFERGPPMLLLAAVFAGLVVLVARWRGLAALGGMVVGLLVVGVFTLPALLQGQPAVPVALVTSVVIMYAVLYLAHGVSVRTSTALAGTLVGLAATAAIASWASGSAHLTGLSGEYALDLMSAAPEVRLRSVLLCGMVLAGLGVLNDVTITQASAVWELHAARPGSTWRELVGRGMRIGRDHIASTVYTIVFAYVGAALPLVLLVSLTDRGLLGVLSSGDIAEEVVRTLVGSIGLVLAIPVTTVLAALLVRGSATGTSARPDDEPGDDAADGSAPGPDGPDRAHHPRSDGDAADDGHAAVAS